MLRNENRVEINRSPEDVFAFIADLRNEPKYVPNVIETEKLTDGPAGVGARYREVTRVMFGRKAVATYEVTHYEPPTKFAFRGTSGRSRFRGRWVLEATGDGTIATFTAEAHLAWPMKYMERVVRGSVAATFAAMGRNLQRMLRPVPEAGGVAAKPAAAKRPKRAPGAAASPVTRQGRGPSRAQSRAPQSRAQSTGAGGTSGTTAKPPSSGKNAATTAKRSSRSSNTRATGKVERPLENSDGSGASATGDADGAAG